MSLQAQPRLGAKKFVYVIGGSHRELGSAWTHSEFTYDSVEMFDIYNKCWHQVSTRDVTNLIAFKLSDLNSSAKSHYDRAE